jgi:hypothetical protein
MMVNLLVSCVARTDIDFTAQEKFVKLDTNCPLSFQPITDPICLKKDDDTYGYYQRTVIQERLQ